jgi:hypothetical protein
VELQALVSQKDEIITARDETILHREDQINESDAIITQRNTIIEFLQEQIHDLIHEADDAQAHIEELQQPPVPLAAPQYLKVEKKIRKKLKESQITTPSMEIRSLILSQITLHLAVSLL